MDRGYFKIFRKFFENELWTEPRKLSRAEAWLDILYQARWQSEPCKVLIGNQIVTCRCGQSLNSNLTWARRWRWSEPSVRRFMKLLETRHMVERETVAKTTRLTVCNFEYYQKSRRQDDVEVTPSRRDGDAMVTTEEERKELQEEKTKNTLLESGDSSGNGSGKSRNIYDKDFEAAWLNHGRKDGSKFKAYKKWQQLKKLKVLPDLSIIISAQDSHKRSDKWQRGFCPYFETWLNGRCWESSPDFDPTEIGCDINPEDPWSFS